MSSLWHDLLMYRDQEGPYNSTAMPWPRPEHLPLTWEGHLQVLVAADGRLLPIDIPLTSLPWIEPHGQIRWLKPGAKKFGKPLRTWEREYLQQFKKPPPHLGQRVWRFSLSEETPTEEVLPHLVIVAWKQGFPVSTDDQQTARQWVQHVVQEGVRYLGEGDSQQMSEDVLGEVFEALRQRFDLPATPWTLQDFIKETARGLVKGERKKHALQTCEPWDDPATGERRYPDARAAQVIGKSERTVDRWKESHAITTAGLSETQLEAIQWDYKSKQQRESLMAYLTETLGKKPNTARTWLRRCLNKGESLKDITTNLLRRQGRNPS
jgi:hypothetical protein